MTDYVQSFIIGSSWPVFVSFFLIVATIEKNYTFETYAVLAPLVLGLFNVLSLFLAKQFNLSQRKRFVVIGLLAPMLIFLFTFLTRAYDKTPREWLTYAGLLLLQYFLVFNLVVYNMHNLFYNTTT